MSDHYMLKGRTPVPVDDLLEWARWMESGDRRVALTEGDGWKVSTVFLGLDHRWGGGPPVLFESMIFGGARDQEQDRYSTWEEAEAGHAAMVEWARGAGE